MSSAADILVHPAPITDAGIQSKRSPNLRTVAVMLLLSVLLLHVPMLVEFGGKLWLEDDSHSGLLLLCVIGAYWHARRDFRWGASTAEFVTGWAVIAVAFVAYFLGRVTDLVQLLGFSMPALATGLCLITGGRQLLRRVWMLNLLLLFTIPWFGPFADAILVPLRLFITSAAVTLLNHLGFPISATGVIVNVGFVQLDIAGACVGLRSTVSIFALGLLSLHFFPPRSWAAGLLFLLLLPIVALCVNFLRVCTLILIAASSGATALEVGHDIAAYVEVVVSIGLFLLIGSFFSAGPRVQA